MWRPGLRVANPKRMALQAAYRALGIPWHGGRPRKPERVASMADKAVTVLVRQEAELATAIGDAMTRPIDDLTPPEALGRATLSGIRRLIEIVEQPVDLSDLKQQRLIGDMALGAAKLYMRAAEAEFRGRQQGELVELLEKLAEIRRASAEER